MNQLHIDLPLMIAVLLASTVSAIAIFSASNSSEAFLTSHLIRIGLSILAMILAAQFSPLFYSRISPWLYAICLILLIAVFFFGETRNNATRWIDIGISFQPSELLKIAMPLVVARYIASGSIPLNNTNIVVSLVLVLLPTALIFKQPDLGTSILIGISGIVVLWLAGLNIKYFFYSSLALLISLPFVISFLKPYQKLRVLSFFNPDRDPLGAGYQIIQSKIAVGSGGLTGKGFLKGTQSYLEFLPEKHTDFIFTLFSEEHGFIGSVLLLIIYAILIYRIIKIGSISRSYFGKLFCYGFGSAIFVYVTVNMSMVLGLLPIVGSPLPIMSYGGSSMLATMIGFGIVMSARVHNQQLIA